MTSFPAKRASCPASTLFVGLLLMTGISGCAADAAFSDDDVAQSESNLVVGSIHSGQTVTVPVVGGQSFRQLSFAGVAGEIVEADVRDVRDSSVVQARPVLQLQAGGGAFTDLRVANSLVYGRAWQRARVTTSGTLYIAVGSRASTSYEVTLRTRPCNPQVDLCVTPLPPPPPCTIREWSCVYRGDSAGGMGSYIGRGRTRDEACISAKALCDNRRPRLGSGCYIDRAVEVEKPCP